MTGTSIVVATLGVGAACAAVMMRRYLVVVSVFGDSMQPTLQSGDRILVRRVSGDALRVGDLAVVAPPQPPQLLSNSYPYWIVKRVAAISGDPLPAVMRSREDVALSSVPRGYVVLLGDNAAASIDSRQFGLVPTDSLLGAVIRRLAR